MSSDRGAEGRPGRYPRSFSGLLGSMVVVVLVVVGFVVFRGVFSRDLEVTPEAVDYLDTVSQLQDGGIEPVYPAALPDGWIATNVSFVPSDPAAFGVSLLTDDGTFVGVRQDDTDAEALLDQYLTPDQADAQEADGFQTDGSVAPAWQGWVDDGEDHGFTAEVDGGTVLVFGSASVADLQVAVESLTTEPVAG